MNYRLRVVCSRAALILGIAAGLSLSCGASDQTLETAGNGGGGPTCQPTNPPCDLLPQCGCGTAQSCDVVADDGTTACFDSLGIDVGSACNAYGSCLPGLTCLRYNACKKMCTTTEDCTAIQGSKCIPVPRDNNVDLVPNLQVCTDQCDLVNPANKCGPGAGCWPMDGAASLGASPGYSECYKAGTSTATCSTKPEECAPGYMCVTNSQTQAKGCYKFCHPGESGTCPAGKICNSMSGGQYFYVGTSAFGLCYP